MLDHIAFQQDQWLIISLPQSNCLTLIPTITDTIKFHTLSKQVHRFTFNVLWLEIKGGGGGGGSDWCPEICAFRHCQKTNVILNAAYGNNDYQVQCLNNKSK